MRRLDAGFQAWLDGSNDKRGVVNCKDGGGSGTPKIYWTDWGAGKIQRANLDGTGVEDLVSGLKGTSDIALDLGTRKMYWSATEAGKIQRANLDGTGVEDLVSGLDWPRGTALDLDAGKMYWSATEAGKIQRANLDGTGVEDLVSGLDDPNDIELDPGSGKMYWTNSHGHKIQRANLDGTGVEDLVLGLDNPLGIALDLSTGKMYWTDNQAKKIQRANLDGTGVEDLITTWGPDGIALDLGQRQDVLDGAGCYDHDSAGEPGRDGGGRLGHGIGYATRSGTGSGQQRAAVVCGGVCKIWYGSIWINKNRPLSAGMRVPRRRKPPQFPKKRNRQYAAHNR